jgi:dihydrofolate synthase / folylpolyglutamate synthase
VAYRDLLAQLAGVRALGVELGLDRMRAALARLGDPQRRFAAVQIAGTNGKGSTAAMTEAILRAHGLSCGLYTSPHLARFSERIRVNGAEADGDRLAEIGRRVAETGVPLTYFEIATALAFVVFAEDAIDVAVLETGLGGRLDAVTTAEPLATAITSIGFDHMAYLGGSLREIAYEKAGILRPGIPAFLGRLPAEADDEVTRVAAGVNAPLVRLGRELTAPAMPLGLPGAHQRDNAALALALAGAVLAARQRHLDPTTVADALADVRWPGRLEPVADDVLLDCAHNADGAASLAAALADLAPGRRVVLLVSVVDDKDPGGMFSALARTAAAVVVTRSSNPRALPTDHLAAVARTHFAAVTAIDDPLTALATARRLAAPAGLVVVCGSMFLVGALRAHLLGEPTDPEFTSDPV